MNSPIIYSDDGTLAGSVEFSRRYWNNGTTYIARIWDVRTPRALPLLTAVFDDGVSAENWMLDRLECPLFTLLLV